MKKHLLSDFTKGWLIGDFTPALHQTKDFEVSVKHYFKGDYEALHHHKVAVEYTVIVNGRFKMNGREVVQGDVLEIEPGEATDFECLEDGATCVVKLPSVKGDKYMGEAK